MRKDAFPRTPGVPYIKADELLLMNQGETVEQYLRRRGRKHNGNEFLTPIDTEEIIDRIDGNEIQLVIGLKYWKNSEQPPMVDANAVEGLQSVLERIGRFPKHEHLLMCRMSVATINGFQYPVLQDFEYLAQGLALEIESQLQAHDPQDLEIHTHHADIPSAHHLCSIGDIRAMVDSPEWKETENDASEAPVDSGVRVMGIISVVRKGSFFQHYYEFWLQLYRMDVRGAQKWVQSNANNTISLPITDFVWKYGGSVLLNKFQKNT